MPEVLEQAPLVTRSRLLRFFATGPDVPAIQDPKAVDRLYRRCRTQLMLTIMIGYGLMYTCRLGLSVIKKPLIDGRLFTAGEFGHFEPFFFYGYAFGRLVNGFLADHANLKKFLTLGVLCSAMINLMMGTWHSLWLWAMLWGLNGWFQGFGSPASIVSIARWFRASERGRAYGSWSIAHSLGEGVSFIATAGLVALLGWRAGLIGPGVLCCVVAVAVFHFMLDRPQTLGLPAIADWKPELAPGQPVEAPAARESIWSQIEILRLPSLWIICLASAAMYVTRYAVNSWGMFYLQEDRKYSLIEAGSIMGVSTFAGLAGCVAYGFISDKLFAARRPPVTLIYGLIEVLSLLVIFYLPPGHPVILTAAFAVYGFTLSGLLAVLGGLFAMDIVPKKAVGAAIGMTGIVSYLGAALQARVSPLLIEEGHRVIDGASHYDFSRPILFWVGSSVLSLILATSLWRVKVRE